MKFILGRKLGMTTIYSQDKGAVNVTLLECEPNKVSLVRTLERDEYSAVQVEVQKTSKKVFRKEFRISESEGANFELGSEIGVDIFEVGEIAAISGVSKAKGFQGVMKRHGFHGSPASHGHRHDHRAPGSIGSAYPQHVVKGKKMAGRMGGDNHTTKGVEIAYVDKEKNLVGIKGAVPGINGGMIELVVA
ncbi:50S ribosomal protein L3 [Patescibacteria group bacterium]